MCKSTVIWYIIHCILILFQYFYNIPFCKKKKRGAAGSWNQAWQTNEGANKACFHFILILKSVTSGKSCLELYTLNLLWSDENFLKMETLLVMNDGVMQRVAKSVFVSHQCGYVWARLWLPANLLQKLFRVWPLSFHWVCWDVGGFRLQIWSITALRNPRATLACLLSGAAQILTRSICHPKFLKGNVSWCCLVIAITLQSSSCDWKPWKRHYPVRRTTCWSHPSLSLELTTIC